MNSSVNQNIWILFKGISTSIAVFLAINLTTFFLAVIFYGLSETWGFEFKYGVFSLNGRVLGLKFLEPASNGLMLVAFMAAIAYEVKQSPLVKCLKENLTKKN